MNFVNSWSLEGEDIIALALLRDLKTGYYFDIGCASPIHLSNTWKFYKQGWRGLAVDARSLHEEWKLRRPYDIFTQKILGDGSDVIFYEFPDPHMSTCDTATILRYSERFPKESIVSKPMQTVRAGELWSSLFPSAIPDLVSIDVEGHELSVLNGFNLVSERPKLFIVELKNFNFMHPKSHPLVTFFYDNFYALISKTPLDGFFIDTLSPAFDWIPASMK
jgi:hypothetical protein